jgi:hypothetical protein
MGHCLFLNYLNMVFKKGRCTRDCLALLTTDFSTSFEMKRQTVAAFLDISGAYLNVLIDVLCGVKLKKELPLGIVRCMWCKTLVYYVAGAYTYQVKRLTTGFSFEPISVQLQLTLIWYR